MTGVGGTGEGLRKQLIFLLSSGNVARTQKGAGEGKSIPLNGDPGRRPQG